ncbi:acyltransferase [Paraburkholderia sp. J67]|uniref:acyltransferase family protein n=1 Tax=Paraburkholderia sp. J67 TaxID=2805435 RepID=UPI002ABD55E9|nr:acyltransferase [Paraburkholderia sp. J67]
MLLFSTRPLRCLDEPAAPGESRSGTIDGLRAFLALGVFFAHASGYYIYMTTSTWGPGPNRFFNQLGDVGVFLFFIITSFLFWGKAIAATRRIHEPAEYRRYLTSLYVARFFRIAPLYYCAIGTMIVLTLSATGLRLVVSPIAFAKEIINWLPLGLGASVWINGSDTPPVTVGMVWTLAWEWYFYFSLAALSLLAFSRTLRLIAPALTLAIALVAGLHWHIATGFYIALFSMGMIFATRTASGMSLRKLPEPLGSFVAAALIALAYFGVGGPRSGFQLVWIAAFFYLVISGCDLFGLLKSRAAQRLGTISYSIYLMHGLCLHVVFSIAPIRTFAFASITQYWLAVLLAAIVTIGVSTLTFLLIEAPGIQLGRHVLGKLRQSRGAREAQATPIAT